VGMTSHRDKLEGEVLQVLECRDTDEEATWKPPCWIGRGGNKNYAN
jgi:hypothetical protein